MSKKQLTVVTQMFPLSSVVQHDCMLNEAISENIIDIDLEEKNLLTWKCVK